MLRFSLLVSFFSIPLFFAIEAIRPGFVSFIIPLYILCVPCIVLLLLTLYYDKS